MYDFTTSRSGVHARTFFGHHGEAQHDNDHKAWRGSLVCDDFSGYKALFIQGVTEAGCMAHARRKFIELHIAHKSTVAATAVELIGQLYGIEREVKDLPPEQRLQERRTRATPIAQALHGWLTAQRVKVTDGTATAKAIDYSLNRWAALTRYLDDPRLPIDNNHDEQQIRPWATGRKNWLFAGTLMAGQRAAAIMSLIQSAKLNGHDPYAYQAIDYSLNRWAALTRYLDDPRLPIDNNHDEQQIRPWATGRKNWLFAGTLMAGQRAAAIMSLIQSAKLNGHDPYAYLKDVLTRLPTHRAREIDALLPNRWTPTC